MKIFIQAFALIAIAMGMVSHADAAETAIAIGTGTRTCAQFAQDYKRDVSSEITYFAWAQGYMSGMNAIANVVAKLPTRDLRAIPYQDQERQVREYCDQHPLGMYVEAIVAVMGALPTVPYGK